MIFSRYSMIRSALSVAVALLVGAGQTAMACTRLVYFGANGQVVTAAAKGEDPTDARRKGREIPTFKEASDEFMRSFRALVDAAQKKLTTYKAYRITLDEAR